MVNLQQMLMRSVNPTMTRRMKKSSMNLTPRAALILRRRRVMKNPPKNLRINPRICQMNLKKLVMKQQQLRLQIIQHQKKKSLLSLKRRKRHGYRIYVDIMTGENCRQFRLLTWTSFIGQLVFHYARGDGVKWVGGGIVI